MPGSDNSSCHGITWENSGSRRNQRQRGAPELQFLDRQGGGGGRGGIHHPERIIFRQRLQEAGWERRGLLLDISQPCGTEPRSPLSHSLSWKRLDGGPDSWPPPRTLGNGAACCLRRKRKVTAQNTQTRNASSSRRP